MQRPISLFLLLLLNAISAVEAARQNDDGIENGLKKLKREFKLSVEIIDQSDVSNEPIATGSFFNYYRLTNRKNRGILIPAKDASDGAFGSRNFSKAAAFDGSMPKSLYFTLHEKLLALKRLRKYDGPKIYSLARMKQNNGTSVVGIIVEDIDGSAPQIIDSGSEIFETIRRMEKKYVVVDPSLENWILSRQGELRPLGIFLFKPKELKADDRARDTFRGRKLHKTQATVGRISQVLLTTDKELARKCGNLLEKIREQSHRISHAHH